MAIPEWPDKKTSIFVVSGIVLYLGSSYLNVLKADSGTWGVWIGLLLIVVATAAQIKNWFDYWNKKLQEQRH